MPLIPQIAKLAFENPEMRGSLVPILRSAKEFDTKEQLEQYLKDHPNADKTKHKVKEEGAEGKKKDEEPKKKPGDVQDEADKKKIKLEVPAEAVAEFSGEIPEYHIEIIAGGEGGEITEADLRRAKAIKAQIKRGIEAAADVCKMSPPVCEGNLGVYRESMPQLSADESVKKMLWSDDERIEDNNGGKGFATKNTGWKPVSWDELSEDDQASLKKDWATARKKGQAAVDAGADPDDDRTVFQQLLDGLGDEGVEIGSQEPPYEQVDVGKLKATQREIKAGKTFGMADSYFSGNYDPSKAPIIISSDNHILDGHHRYSAMITADPDAKMNVIRVDMPMRDFLERSFTQPGVFRADLQDNIIDSNTPLDLSREKGSTWQQPGNDGYFAKNEDGETGGPFKSEKAAKDFASGKKSKGKKAYGEKLQSATEKEFLQAIRTVPWHKKKHIDGGKRSMTVEYSDRGTLIAEKTLIYTRGKVSQTLYMVNPDYLKGRRASSRHRASLIRLAASLPKGSKERKTILNKLAGRFNLGRVVQTRGIDAKSRRNPSFATEVATAFRKYQRGDWGDTQSDSVKRNNDVLRKGVEDQVFAVYNTSEGKIYIITEWDGSVTTILFANEY